MDLSKFFTTTDLTLEIIVWSMFAGICVAVIVSLLIKRMLGDFTEALLKSGAKTPETAKTAAELGFAKSRMLRFALRNGSAYRKTVYAAGSAATSDAEAGADKPSSGVRAADRRFYIPESKAERAEALYKKERAPLMTALIAIILFFMITVFCLSVIPKLNEMLQALISQLNPGQNI